MSLVRLTCREAARLLTQRQERALGPVERMRLRLHLGICDMCTRFNAQLRLMDRAMARWRAYRDDAGD